MKREDLFKPTRQDQAKTESTILPDPKKSQPITFINTASAEKRVWLVKIPKFVQEAWSQIPNEGVEIGTIRIYKDKSKKATLHIPEHIASVGKISRNYEMGFATQTQDNNYVFTEDPNSHQAISIAGKIHHEANATPVIDDDYRKIMAERTKIGQVKRTIERQDDKKGLKQQFVVPNINPTVSGFGSLKKARDLDKRERLPRSEVLNMLFSAFTKEEFLGLKALSDLTNQPLAYLKELLAEIATMERRGPQIGQYRLNDELKLGVKSETI